MISVFKSVVTFSNELSIVTVGVVAAIFTFSFVQATKKTLLTPFIVAYISPGNPNKMVIDLKNEQKLCLGEFIAELIQWIIFMAVCYFAWLLTRSPVEKN